MVALEQAVAAPFASSRLADAGARVIKLERPEGDFARGYDAAAKGQSSYFVWLNRGKESVTMDLARAGDRALFEASGNSRALAGALAATKPRGVIVQLGLGGDVTLPMNLLVAKEFDLRGSFRFHEEFAQAVDFIGKRLIDVRPLITATVPLAEAARGFAMANDRSQAMKVQISFE